MKSIDHVSFAASAVGWTAERPTWVGSGPAAFGNAFVVGSMGGRNSSFFEEKECGDEAASADLLLGGTAIRDLGPLAARGVDEFDRPAV